MFGPIRLHVDAYPGQNFSGQVYAIEPAIDEKTRTALLRARVVSSGFFAVLGIAPERGRDFNEMDGRAGAPMAAVASTSRHVGAFGRTSSGRIRSSPRSSWARPCSWVSWGASWASLRP